MNMLPLTWIGKLNLRQWKALHDSSAERNRWKSLKHREFDSIEKDPVYSDFFPSASCHFIFFPFC